MRQHLIVAQTINSVCRTWPGAPKVVATSGGWLVSGPTGATVAIATVEALWAAVYLSNPGMRSSEMKNFVPEPGPAEDLSLRVLSLGYQMARTADTSRGS
jgi:hypothetical protein